MFGNKTEEEKAAKAEAKEQRKEERAEKRFRRTPAGQARTAYENGDMLFQVEFDVLSQSGDTMAMRGASTDTRANVPTAVLNEITREGWKLHTASFTFVQTGEVSRDKFMSSGQQVAVQGKVLGYYVFERNDASLNRPDDSLLAVD